MAELRPETLAESLRSLVRPASATSDRDAGDSCAARLRLAVQMVDAGIDMMRMKLRRDFPEESEQDRRRRLLDWLHRRPGAAFGDGEGVAAGDRFSPS